MKKLGFVFGGATIALSLAFYGAPAAVASPDSNADFIVAAVAEVAPLSLEGASLKENAETIGATFDDGGEVTIPFDPTESIDFVDGEGKIGASVTLPNSTSLMDAQVSTDGSVSYVGDALTPSVNVLAAVDAVRVSTVIADEPQPEEFTYEFGAGATVEIRDDGSAAVYRVDSEASVDGTTVETVIATIQAPWAFDANGQKVQTEYTAIGSTLTQTVHHQGGGYTYPIVADPSFDQPNIFQSRIRFNRAETATIAQNGIWALGGAVCGPVMALACIFAAGSLAWNAGVAENSRPKKCVHITATNTFSPANIIWWVDTYSGGPCK